MIKYKENSEHYKWGCNCDGWHLVETNDLSIIQEIMPSGSSEKLHYHRNAQQFFYILNGTATFEVEGKTHEVKENQGFHISPNQQHRISNKAEAQLEFIVTSQPKAHGDRIDVGE